MTQEIITRTVDTHHDGLGLNDLITVYADDIDPNAGGASHFYRAVMTAPDGEEVEVARIQFQHGARLVDGSTAGITEAVLYAIILDRLACFQKGPFACRENDIQATKTEEALMWTERRARLRHRRGVLGKNEK